MEIEEVEDPEEGVNPLVLAIPAAILLARRRDDARQARVLAQIAAARRRSDRLIDRTVMSPVRRSYDENIGRIVSGLGRLFKGTTRNIATSQTLAATLSFLRTAVPGLSQQVTDALFNANRGTTAEAIRSTSRFVSVVQQVASPIEDELTMARITFARREALKELQRRASEASAADLLSTLEKRIRRLPISDLKISEMLTEAGIALDDEWWRTERTVRTVTSSVYNAAQADAIAEIAQEPAFRKMKNRWTERIDDVTGQPFDDRVAPDSMVLHGQVTKPSGLFTMPPSPRVNVDMHGKSWSHPPNRPNDRAVLTPWMQGWKVPAWVWQGGSRITL